MATKDTILYTMLVCMALAMGYMLYIVNQLQAGMPDVTVSDASSEVQDGGATRAGSKNILNAVRVKGVAQNISGTSLSVHTETGETIMISVPSGTPVVRLGETKSEEQFDREMEAYNARIAELRKDPVKNKSELEALEHPTLSTEIPITLSEISIGNEVSIAVNEGEGSTRTARKVLLLGQTN